MKILPITTTLCVRKHAIAQRFAHASDYDHHANIQQQVCQILLSKIIKTSQSSVLEVGAGTGQLTQLLAAHICSEQWLINELSHHQRPVLQAILPQAHVVIGDAENIELGLEHSLIISANAVQWFDDPVSFIKQAYQRLQSGGQLLFNTFTPNNFYQIKSLTNQGLHYPSIDTWQMALKQESFCQIKLSTRRFDSPFPNPYAVLRHMKLTGVSVNQTVMPSNKPPFIWTKSRLQQFEASYWQQFTAQDNQGNPCVILTYEVLIIEAIKP